MPADMLGGDVTQIQQGAATYRVLGDHLAACGGQVVSTTDGAVAGLQEQLGSAQNAVVSSVQAVSQESRSTMSGLSGIVWTDGNRAQVEEVGTELDMRVTETTARIQELFETFRAELGRLGGSWPRWPPSSTRWRCRRASPPDRWRRRWIPRPPSSTR